MTPPDSRFADRCGYASDFKTFSGESPIVIRASLASFVRDASSSQLRAWDASIPVVQDGTREAIEQEAGAQAYTAILEYQLPLESRRPDVILLENGVVIVIEFKGKQFAETADLDQVAAYARDLRCYHRECASPRRVIPVLVPIRYGGTAYRSDGTWVVSPPGLEALISSISHRVEPPLEPVSFLRPEAYCPLPTLVKAARELFEAGTLRNVWRATAATDPAVKLITDIVHEAARTRTRRLILLTGLPGSGKTLVGLRLVHAGFLDDLAVGRDGGKPTAPAVFLSGNGPLVQVLQYELRKAGGSGKTFVRDVKAYVETYSKKKASTPPEHLLVFDEAQRAWDADQVAAKHGREHAKSEPEHFIEFAERVPEWCVVLGLIGTGQEIHRGEEGGLVQWRTAIESSRRGSEWQVHGPAAAVDVFAGSSVSVFAHRPLSLDTELRYHLSPRIHQFVEALLSSPDPTAIRQISDGLFQGGFRLHVTRDLAAAKSYAAQRYAENPEARFGMLASSRDKDLPAFGVLNGYQDTKTLRVGPWFSEGADNRESCRQLTRPATEFAAQGLELDLGIVCWGTDFRRDKGRWSDQFAKGFKKGSKVKNPFQLRLNSYRVLLTRGRDGNVVFVPPMPVLDETFNYLVECGFRPLDGAGVIP